MKNLKFIILSLIGITLFFIPIYKSTVPIIILVNFVKCSLDDFKESLIIFITFVSVIYFGISIKTKNSLKKERLIFFVSIITFVLLLLLRYNIILKETHDEVFNLIYGIAVTSFICGCGVVFIIYSGLVEFVSFIIEPIMRNTFLLPGHSAIDCLSSFISSPTIGVFITSKYYEDNKYTHKEACAISVNFSMVSIGFMATLCTMANINYLYNVVILISFLLAVLLAFITIRIPPLSNMPNVYADGSSQATVISKKMKFKNRLTIAFNRGIVCSKKFTITNYLSHIRSTIKFLFKMIVLAVIPLIIMLYISSNTTILELLGMPIVPFLRILNISNPTIVAPATIIGLVEVALPVMYISNYNIAIKSVFIVVVLSIVQVVFLAETGVVLLASSIPIKFKELLLIFLIRTIIALPILAVISEFLF